jgi:sugar phosphate permease
MAVAVRNRWVMLGTGTAAQTVGTVYLYGLPYLVPALVDSTGWSLWQVGLLVGCPSFGMVLALLGWGVLTDRRGERLVVLCGLFIGAAFLAAAALSSGALMVVMLVLAGAAGSAVYASSGRIVVGWFAPGQRGVAMGIRQTSQPFGVAIAAAVLPALALRGGPRLALLVIAAALVLIGLVTAALLVDGNAPVAARASTSDRSPYRESTLWWLHGASLFLVVPQFAIGGFALEYLVEVRDWSAVTAGHLLAVAQLTGAVGRIVAGRWSDRVGSRLGPLRLIGLATSALIGALSAAAAVGSAAAVPLLIFTIAMTLSWHGVGYAAVTELVPPQWTGRALSAQTIAQNIGATVTPPLAGVAIGTVGFAGAFAVTLVPPLCAAIILHRLIFARRHSVPAHQGPVPVQTSTDQSRTDWQLASNAGVGTAPSPLPGTGSAR